jgi:hypothetical protein
MSLKKFLCIQRSQPGQPEPSGKPTPEQMKAMYAKFDAWMAKFQNNIVDLGGRLGDGAVVTAASPTDGPFAEGNEDIGGFMILTARNLQEAIAVARACPGLVSPGSGVEVREIQTPG